MILHVKQAHGKLAVWRGQKHTLSIVLEMLALSCLTVIPMYKILPTKWRAFVLTSTSQCSWSLGHYDHVLPKRGMAAMTLAVTGLPRQ